MFLMRAMIALVEFFAAALVSVTVVYVMYRVFVVMNKDYDGEAEIEKGNIAVAVLTAGIMVSSAQFIQHGLESVEHLFLLYMTTPVHEGYAAWKMALLAGAHLFFSFLLAIFTVTFSLRLFGKFCARMHLGHELKKGNVAVGILLAGVIFVICAFVGDGVNSLSSVLLPQPSIGEVEVMK